MLIQNGAAPSALHRPATPAAAPKAHGDHAPAHGSSLIPMEAVHIAHDVAMIGMSLPLGGSHGGHHGHGMHGAGHGAHGMHGGYAGHGAMMGDICGTPPKPGTFDAFTNGGIGHQGLTLLSAAAAAGATYHGVQHLQHGHIAHGVNHILMGAGSGAMAAAMATGSGALHTASSVLMGAHGAMEVGLGVQAFVNAKDAKGKAMAATTAIHGACLAGAQMTSNALFTIPLYLGMGAATVVQVALKHS